MGLRHDKLWNYIASQKWRYTKHKTILQNEYRWKGLIKEIPEQKELRNNINSVPSYKQYKQKQRNNY
jgi:hypothetical protein